MPPWLRRLLFHRGPSSVPSTYIRHLTTLCDSNSRASDSLSWSLEALPTDVGTQTHTYFLKNKTKIIKMPYIVNSFLWARKNNERKLMEKLGHGEAGCGS